MVGSWEEGKCGQRHAVISSFHDANEATPGTLSQMCKRFAEEARYSGQAALM